MRAVAPTAGEPSSPNRHGLTALKSREELRLAGRVSGVLYLTAAVTAPALLLPGPGRVPLWILVSEVALAGIWGAACLTVVPWERAPWWLSHASTAAGLVLTALLIAASGGTESEARLYVLFVIMFAAYFYPRREALAFIGASGVVLALPLLYESGAIHRGLLRELVIGVPVYVVTGAAIIGGRVVADRLRGRAARLSSQRERLAAEHASLRRVATAVATSAPPRAVFTLVAAETMRLMGAVGAAVVRYDGDEVELVGACGPGGAPYPVGTRFTLRAESEMTTMRTTGKPVRTDGYPRGSKHRAAGLGYQCCICAPVWVEQELWGGLSVVSHDPSGLPGDAEDQLEEFAHLLATSISNTERQSELVRRASLDALTELPNHRSFHEHLEAEVARALRHERSLSLALVNVDRFKLINERLGHNAGDSVLKELSQILLGLTRKGDLLARLGADEFGMLLPETDKRSAFVVLERARQALGRRPLTGIGRVSFTAGVCDLESAGGEASLYRLADAALHWGKTHGRDVSWVYDPQIVSEPTRSADQPDVERLHALAALQALSRAIDAKDPLTREHSERVAALATALANVAGWTFERSDLMESAALVHDVGKIGVPDAILLKPGPLEAQEFEVIKQHASLGAQIVEGVLGWEQVEWVRSHHERPDGRGYPNGLLGASISEGAALLAMADAFDAMTSPRSYGSPKDIETAVSECRDLAGRQFTRDAVQVLETVYEQGLLTAA